MPAKRDVVIAGGGRVGLTTAQQLSDQGHDVIVIERSARRCEELGDEYVATIIEGDATDPDLLEQAAVDECDVVGALTGHTGTNLAVALEARELNPDVRTVVRIDRFPGEAYTRFADAVIFPERAGGRLAATAMVGEDVQAFSEAPGELELVYVRVAEGAPAAGKTLGNVAFPEGSLVISGEAGNRVASAETVLEPGEQYIVAAESAVVDEVVNLLRG